MIFSFKTLLSKSQIGWVDILKGSNVYWKRKIVTFWFCISKVLNFWIIAGDLCLKTNNFSINSSYICVSTWKVIITDSWRGEMGMGVFSYTAARTIATCCNCSLCSFWHNFPRIDSKVFHRWSHLLSHSSSNEKTSQSKNLSLKIAQWSTNFTVPLLFTRLCLHS